MTPHPSIERIPARALKFDDVTTGTGERVLGVSAGVRTPRGKVEVVLEKDACTRTATWGAGTLIGVTRQSAQIDVMAALRASVALLDAAERK
jgi:hypothetical protein